AELFVALVGEGLMERGYCLCIPLCRRMNQQGGCGDVAIASHGAAEGRGYEGVAEDIVLQDCLEYKVQAVMRLIFESESEVVFRSGCNRIQGQRLLGKLNDSLEPRSVIGRCQMEV